MSLALEQLSTWNKTLIFSWLSIYLSKIQNAIEKVFNLLKLNLLDHFMVLLSPFSQKTKRE